MIGMWQYTSIGCVSPASTVILQEKAGVSSCAVPCRAGAAQPEQYLPLLALVDELLDLLYSAADLLVLGRCKGSTPRG